MAADSTQSASVVDKTLVSDEEGFSLSKVSFGMVVLDVGLSLLSYSFGTYFNLLLGSE